GRSADSVMRLRVAFETRVGRRERKEIAERGDATMPVCDKMLNRLERGRDFVRNDAVRVEMPSRPVDEHERRAGPLFFVEIRVVAARGNDDDSVDAAIAKRSYELALAARVLIAAPCEDEHVSGTCRILDRTME